MVIAKFASPILFATFITERCESSDSFFIYESYSLYSLIVRNLRIILPSIRIRSNSKRLPFGTPLPDSTSTYLLRLLHRIYSAGTRLVLGWHSAGTRLVRRCVCDRCVLPTNNSERGLSLETRLRGRPPGDGRNDRRLRGNLSVADAARSAPRLNYLPRDSHNFRTRTDTIEMVKN